MRTEEVGAFYDGLAASYDLVYADWSASVQRQGQVLDRFLRAALGGAVRVLDCACGIGTQTLGLLERGHDVVACDLSVAAARRAAAEVAARGHRARLLAADMRQLPFRDASFDAVVCADNSLPHLLDESGVEAACAAMATVTRPDGLLLLTLRDYDRLRATRPRSWPPSVADTPDGRVITFQLWHWHPDGEHYDFELFQLFEDGVDWTVTRHTATYWALSRATLDRALEATGWSDVAWREPAESGFFQPVVTARRVGSTPTGGSEAAGR